MTQEPYGMSPPPAQTPGRPPLPTWRRVLGVTLLVLTLPIALLSLYVYAQGGAQTAAGASYATGRLIGTCCCPLMTLVPGLLLLLARPRS